jgi:hypothetical protein
MACVFAPDGRLHHFLSSTSCSLVSSSGKFAMGLLRRVLSSLNCRNQRIFRHPYAGELLLPPVKGRLGDAHLPDPLSHQGAVLSSARAICYPA